WLSGTHDPGQLAGSGPGLAEATGSALGYPSTEPSRVARIAGLGYAARRAAPGGLASDSLRAVSGVAWLARQFPVSPYVVTPGGSSRGLNGFAKVYIVGLR